MEKLRRVSSSEKLFIGRDFNGYVDTAISGIERVHRCLGYGEQN
jgi:hypothetical protein